MATVTKPIALNESFNTTETPSRNIADVLASLGNAISQGAQPVTKKLATNSFKTINGGLVDGLTVQFTPIQSGSGTPSLDNVRPISGHTQVQSKINNTTYTTSLGGTYVGGEAEQVNGNGLQTHRILVMDGVTDGLKFTLRGSGTRNNYYFYASDGYLFGKTSAGWVNSNDMEAYNMIDSHMELFTGGGEGVGFGAYIGSGGTVLQPRIQFGDDSPITTVALANQWLADQYANGTPLQIVYPLATPIALTLTGQTITAEVGTNNVSAPLTGQEIKPDSVIYKDMFTWEDVLKVI